MFEFEKRGYVSFVKSYGNYLQSKYSIAESTRLFTTLTTNENKIFHESRFDEAQFREPFGVYLQYIGELIAKEINLVGIYISNKDIGASNQKEKFLSPRDLLNHYKELGKRDGIYLDSDGKEQIKYHVFVEDYDFTAKESRHLTEYEKNIRKIRDFLNDTNTTIKSREQFLKGVLHKVVPQHIDRTKKNEEIYKSLQFVVYWNIFKPADL